MNQTNQLWEIRDTDIYKPLNTSQVAYAPTYGWYLLDVADQKILFFDLDGKFKKKIASSGQGPGHLNKVQYIFAENGKLYAVSLYRILIFNFKGEFINQIKRTDFSYWLVKIPKGWVSYPHPLDMRIDQEILIFDNELENRHTLTTWKQRVIRKEGSLPYRTDIFCFAVDYRRNMLYLRKPDSNSIEVWNLRTRTNDSVISIGIKLNPDMHFKELISHARKNGTGIKSNSWYPDMKLDPDGLLYFFPIRSKDKALVFDSLGNQHPVKYKRKILDRILLVTRDSLFISWRDDVNGDIGLRRCSPDVILATIGENQIEE
ncbi:MAG: 6-bladed beta-propeller [Acidobacteriota bacterium]|nr:6-bladed beta-propeller [Acidobacteriota bacterium]